MDPNCRAVVPPPPHRHQYEFRNLCKGRQAVLISPSVIFGFTSDSICQTQPKWPQILRRQCYLAKASKISDSLHKYFPVLNTVHVNPECLELLKALEVQKIIWMRSTSLVAVVAKNTTRGRGKVLSPSYWLKCFLPGIMNFKGFLGRCVKKPSVAQKTGARANVPTCRSVHTPSPPPSRSSAPPANQESGARDFASPPRGHNPSCKTFASQNPLLHHRHPRHFSFR